MKRKNLIKSGIIYVSAMLMLMGCSGSSEKKETTALVASQEESMKETTAAKKSTEEKTTVEQTTTEPQTTEEETTTELQTETEIETVVETTYDAEWEKGKVSGSLEDYEKYFQVENLKDYMVTNEKAGKLTDITYTSAVLSADREATVYLPYGYDENETYPIIYLIHGIGCDKGQWTSMGANKMFDNLIASGTVKPFIAVFPSVIPVGGLDKNTLSNTNIQAFKDFVQEFDQDLAPYMAANYSVSSNREDTAICGLSMGGMEALRVGFTYLDKFAFIGSFSAAPTLETELLKVGEFVPELVLVCSGDKDSTVGDNPYNYHLELEKNGVDHIWYYHPGQSHSPSVWNLGLYNFLTRLSGGFVY